MRTTLSLNTLIGIAKYIHGYSGTSWLTFLWYSMLITILVYLPADSQALLSRRVAQYTLLPSFSGLGSQRVSESFTTTNLADFFLFFCYFCVCLHEFF